MEEKEISGKLRDVLSLVILLENDMYNQKSDDVYVRTLRIIHETLKSIITE